MLECKNLFISAQANIRMAANAYLIKASGWLQSVVDGPCGEEHYDSIDINPFLVNVKASRPVLPYLKKLIRMFGANEMEEGGDPARINLLYEKESDELDVMPFDVMTKPFDFFVDVNGKRHRFSYINGVILYKRQRLDKKKCINDLLGNVSNLELTHIGSLGVKFQDRDDFGVVEEWYSQYEKSHIQEAKEELKKYLTNVEEIVNNDVMRAEVAKVLSNDEPQFEPVNFDELAGFVREERFHCDCFDYEGHVKDAVNELVSEGFVIETDYGYAIAPLYRKGKISTEELAEHKIKPCVSDHLGADILLSLAVDSADIKHITISLREKGYDEKNFSDEKIHFRLKEFTNIGILEKTVFNEYIITAQNRINPNQLTLF